MWNAVKDMLGSKKALATILAVVAWVAARFGLDLDTSELLPVIAPLWLYVVGQGIADAGKESAKIKSDLVREARKADPDPT